MRYIEPTEVDGNIIQDVYIGKYVSCQIVDETVELGVANNVYSLTEAAELEQEILSAMHQLRTRFTIPALKGT
tara:strand:+ start:610 stop:828 length:219 start_codon:yes stop_codon:yes gene_type:complete